MFPLEFWFLGGAVVAFGAAVWLVRERERQGSQDFVSQADTRGWDCRRTPPPGLVAHMARLSRIDVTCGSELYLAGPSAAGPFQLVRAGGPGAARGGRPSSWTFLRVRTTSASSGLWVAPNEHFSAEASGPARVSSGFLRRFALQAEDVSEAERVVGPSLCALLMRPQVPVHLGWLENDLVIAFPLGVSSPRGVDMLLRYGVAVAAALGGAGRTGGALGSQHPAEMPLFESTPSGMS